MNTKYAVCQFLKTGNVFPVRIAIGESEAIRLKAWMEIGAGQFDDWRVVTMAELRELMLADRVDLVGFTAEAQAEKRALILNA